jgi:hypothetical protein
MLPFGNAGAPGPAAQSATPAAQSATRSYPENVNDPIVRAFMREISRGSACP